MMNIYVGNLSGDIGDDDLRLAFETYGQVASATVIVDKFSGESRGFGFVEGEGGDDLFFHHSEVTGAAFEELQEGQMLEYEIGQGRKGPCATSVKLANQ